MGGTALRIGRRPVISSASVCKRGDGKGHDHQDPSNQFNLWSKIRNTKKNQLEIVKKKKIWSVFCFFFGFSDFIKPLILRSGFD